MKLIYPVQTNDPQPPNHPNSPVFGLNKLYNRALKSELVALVLVKKCYPVWSGAEWCYLKAALFLQ